MHIGAYDTVCGAFLVRRRNVCASPEPPSAPPKPDQLKIVLGGERYTFFVRIAEFVSTSYPASNESPAHPPASFLCGFLFLPQCTISGPFHNELRCVSPRSLPQPDDKPLPRAPTFPFASSRHRKWKPLTTSDERVPSGLADITASEALLKVRAGRTQRLVGRSAYIWYSTPFPGRGKSRLYHACH